MTLLISAVALHPGLHWGLAAGPNRARERGPGVSAFSGRFIAPSAGVVRKLRAEPAGSRATNPCGPANPESIGASDRSGHWSAAVGGDRGSSAGDGDGTGAGARPRGRDRGLVHGGRAPRAGAPSGGPGAPDRLHLGLRAAGLQHHRRHLQREARQGDRQLRLRGRFRAHLVEEALEDIGAIGLVVT